MLVSILKLPLALCAVFVAICVGVMLFASPSGQTQALQAQAVQSQTAQSIDTQKIDAFVQETVARNHIPGFALVVVENDRVVLSKGYGHASQDKAVTPQTQFYLGSVSKSFTALAAMQLVEQGKLELDAPVQRYLPWFQVADAEASQKITVRHLLNHTSGLSEGADPGVINPAPTLMEQVQRMKEARLTAPVGTKYQYDSQNYRVLGLLIEQLSGQSFGDYLRDHVFLPLGMTHSIADPKQAPNLAQGHSTLFGQPFAREQQFRSAAMPSGYLITSGEDMGRYLIAMLNQASVDGRAVVKSETLQQMMTPPNGLQSEYGMGWISTTMDGYKTVFHGGNIDNFHAFIMLRPEQRVGYAFLCNESSIYQMMTGLQSLKTGLASAIVGDPTPEVASFEWIIWLLAAFVTLTLAFQVFRIVRLPGWLKRISRRPRWFGWLSLLIDLIGPPLIFFGVPAFMNSMMGASASWLDGYNMQPDIVAWLMAFLALGFICGLTKLVLVIRHVWPRRASIG